MISNETLENLAREYQTSVFPNVVREYFQHLFLHELYKLPNSENLLFKGGTALRIIYGSPRFSEDLDFSLFKIVHHQKKEYVENLFASVLANIERIGIKVDLNRKSNITDEGYFGEASFQIYDYPRIDVVINISSRNGRDIKEEVDTIANNFIPTYNILHLPKAELVNEKIFSALVQRKKPRDFYDLYFIMRKSMLSQEQKQKLAQIKDQIIQDARSINFKGELGAFLPADQQSIIRDFNRALESELNRQIV
jgi:predicted nucleotidyltransferase component of viral defense system